jgi:small GTP-binding protein
LKVTVIGDGGVGKTTLCHRATEGVFQNNFALTIGLNVFKYELSTKNALGLMLFDLGGQDAKYGANADVFIRGSSAAIVVYDLSSIISFFSLTADWLPFIQLYVPKIPLILVGSKSDIPPEDVEVPEDIVEAFIAENLDQFNIMTPSLQVSAKTGQNVDKMMQQVMDGINLYQTLGIID